jgi:hypothetical protein
MQPNKHLSLKFSYSKASGLLFNKQQIAEAKYFEKSLPTHSDFFTDTTILSAFLEQFKNNEEQISEVTCALSSPYAVLVPPDLVGNNEEEACATILSFHYKNLKGNYTFDTINSLQSALVFSFHKALAETILKHFPNAKLVHEQSVVLETLIRERKFSINNAVYILPEGENLSVYLFKNNKLQLFNQFYIKTTEDIGYYLINIMNSADLNPAEVELKVLSGLYTDKDLINKLAKFFPNSRHFPGLPEKHSIFGNSDFYLLQKQQSCVL